MESVLTFRVYRYRHMHTYMHTPHTYINTMYTFLLPHTERERCVMWITISYILSWMASSYLERNKNPNTTIKKKSERHKNQCFLKLPDKSLLGTDSSSVDRGKKIALPCAL